MPDADKLNTQACAHVVTDFPLHGILEQCPVGRPPCHIQLVAPVWQAIYWIRRSRRGCAPWCRRWWTGQSSCSGQRHEIVLHTGRSGLCGKLQRGAEYTAVGQA